MVILRQCCRDGEGKDHGHVRRNAQGGGGVKRPPLGRHDRVGRWNGDDHRRLGRLDVTSYIIDRSASATRSARLSAAGRAAERRPCLSRFLMVLPFTVPLLLPCGERNTPPKHWISQRCPATTRSGDSA